MALSWLRAIPLESLFRLVSRFSWLFTENNHARGFIKKIGSKKPEYHHARVLENWNYVRVHLQKKELKGKRPKQD
jgi:hypothetical protein